MHRDTVLDIRIGFRPILDTKQRDIPLDIVCDTPVDNSVSTGPLTSRPFARSCRLPAKPTPQAEAVQWND